MVFSYDLVIIKKKMIPKKLMIKKKFSDSKVLDDLIRPFVI